MSWFSSLKKPNKLVEKSVELLSHFSDTRDPRNDESLPYIGKTFTKMIEILYLKRDGREDYMKEQQLVVEMTNSKIIQIGLQDMHLLPIEQRKQFTRIFTATVNYQSENSFPMVELIVKRQSIVDTILSFFDFTELAVYAEEMLKVCIKHESLAKLLLDKQRTDKLTSYLSKSNFDISANAFSVFRELLISAPQSERYVNENCQYILTILFSSLDAANYASCRHALKLMKELCDHYERFKLTFISHDKSLKPLMQLMLSTYKNISYDSLNIFRVIVNSENKTEKTNKILSQNAKPLSRLIHNLLDGSTDQETQAMKEQILKNLSNSRR